MATGAPVVAVAEGGVRETVIQGRVGLLTQRDEAEFAESVERLLQDGALRCRLGREAAAYVREKWSWERAGERLIQYMQEWCRAREAHGGVDA
jgi:glycosyltransferase involved in cell wall biosynthesis